MSSVPSSGDPHPPPPPVIDAAAFPHIIDRIIQCAPFASLLAMRGVSNHMRARVDALLCLHLVIHTAAPDRIPGTYFYTLREPGTGQRMSEPGHTLPMFAFYPGACRLPSASNTFESDQAAGREQVRFVERLIPQPGLTVQRGTDPCYRRANAWCLEACGGVRVLDVMGEVTDELKELAPGLNHVEAIRCIQGPNTADISFMPFLARQAVVLVDLTDETAPGVPYIPALAEGVSALTIVLRLRADDEGLDSAWSIFGHNIPESLVTMNIILVLRPEDADLITHYGEDVLFRMFEVMTPVLHRVRLSIVGLNAEVAPFLELGHHPVLVGGSDTAEDMRPNQPGYITELKRRWFDILDRNVRGRVQHGPESIRHWTELDIQAAIENVDLRTLEEWRAEVGESQWDLVSDLL